MPYTGTLPPKLPRDAGALPLPGPATELASGAKDTGEQGAIPYYFVLLFSFYLLARPEDFFRSLRNIKFALILGSAAIFTWALGVFSGQIKFRKSRELNLMMGLTVWFILGLPFSFWPSRAIHHLTNEWVKIVMIFVVLTQLITSTRRLRHLLWIMFLSGLLATAGTMLLGVGHMEDLVDRDGRVMGITRGFFYGNYLGIAAGVVVPYLVAVLIHTRSFFKQLMLVGCFAAMVYMIVLTASRGNLINIVVTLLLVWAIMLRNSMKAKLIGVLFVIGIVLSVAVAPQAFWVRVGTLWGSEASVSDAAGDIAVESSRARKELFIQSLKASAAWPVFGLGMGNFLHYSGETSGIPLGTHNTFTQASAEGGIPALVMFVMLLATGITRMRRMVRGCEGRPELAQEMSLANATIVSLISFMIGACFAHLAWEYYVYYLSVIGLCLQTIYTLKTGQSLELPKARRAQTSGNGGSKKNGIGLRRLPAAETGTRA